MVNQTKGTKTEIKQHSFRVVWKDLSQPSEMLVKPYIESALHILPNWIQEIIIRDEQSGDSNTALMSTRLNDTYLQVTLVIHTALYRLTPDAIKHTILHELMHMHLSPLTTEIYDMARIMFKDNEDVAAYKLMQRQCENGMEKVVEDLSWKLMGMVWPEPQPTHSEKI